jgi:hypothetical protein
MEDIILKTKVLTVLLRINYKYKYVLGQRLQYKVDAFGIGYKKFNQPFKSVDMKL